MEYWVDLGYPAMHRPGVELATSRSQVRRPNRYTTETTIHRISATNEWRISEAAEDRANIIINPTQI